MRSFVFSVAMVALLLTCACDLVDPARPSAQPDVEVFGNLVEVTRDPGDPTRWLAQVQVGPPRALRAAEVDVGNPTPEVSKGLVATVTVGADTVVVAKDHPVALEDIDPGTEVVVLPVPGTTVVRGSTDLRVEAETLMDFATYRRWRLPKLVAEEVPDSDDPAAINSSGAEQAPVPVAGGTVLYFSAQLRPPVSAEDHWHGAFRGGLAAAGEAGNVRERSYRAQLADEGWTAPQLVVFPGLNEAARQRVSWVSEDETRCLVTIEMPGEPPWVGVATRSAKAAPWGAVERNEAIGPDARDAVYLTGSRTKIVFGSSRDGRERDDLFLYDPKVEGSPMALEPQICSFGAEWNPRTGPEGELYFCREDRQLVFKGGRVNALRLPGPHRIVFTQAAPTADGAWLFFCSPKYRPLVLDQDIYVAALGKDLQLGAPVPVDEWRP
jgi:hypothetical protein